MGSRKLRLYQQEAVKEIANGWKNHKRQIFVMPTGSGKTTCFTYMAKLASDRGKTVLILTHRTELFSQTYSTFEDFGLSPYMINATSQEPSVRNGVFIVMIETLARREHLIQSIHPDLIIIDEAHDGGFTKIIDFYPESYVLGVTATPIGKHFFKYYTNIIQTIDTPDLIDQGFLVPYKAYQMEVEDMGSLKKVGGDYSAKSQYQVFSKVKVFNGVVAEWQSRCKGKKTIVFNCNIKHSDEMTEEFNKAGIKSYSITSKTRESDRKKWLDEFHNGDCMVINNASILTTGYDNIYIESVILNRATDSLILFLQMIGRGSRLCPEINKKDFIVLDFGGNHSRHGLWSQPRTWKLEEKKKKNKLGEAIVKECKSCEAMVYGSARVCQYCGYIFPIAILGDKEGVMREYFKEDIPDKPLKECTPTEIATLIKLDMLKRSQGIGIVRRRGQLALKEFAREMSYSYGWVLRQMHGFKK